MRLISLPGLVRNRCSQNATSRYQFGLDERIVDFAPSDKGTELLTLFTWSLSFKSVEGINWYRHEIFGLLNVGIHVEKINQHYVWRAYLKPWGVNGQVYCHRNGSTRLRSTRRVASEDLFYSIPEIKDEDVPFLELFAVAQSPEGLQNSHRKYLIECRKPWLVKRYLEDLGPDGFKALELTGLGFEGEDLDHATLYRKALTQANEAIANDEEDYLSDIETEFQPHLRSLVEGNTSFYQDPAKAAEFVRYISVQYLRTKNIRESVADAFKSSPLDVTRLWVLFSHIYAINVGRSFFAQRHEFKIVPVENQTSVPFITGDQPILNLHGNPYTNDVPPDMELYYPLSPTRAMFYVKSTNDEHPPTITDSAEIERYNKLIAEHAHEQIFGNSACALEVYKEYI